MPRYNQDPRLSTFYDKNAAVATRQPFTPVEDQTTGAVDFYIDMLDHKLWAAISRISKFTTMRYDGTQHITTISYAAYGKTGYWDVIMHYNGFIHPLEIEPGILIKIPDLGELDQILQKKRQTVPVSGQSVRI